MIGTCTGRVISEFEDPTRRSCGLPAQRVHFEAVSSFARVIVFDKRGQGPSDRVREQTLEERIGDVITVMAAGFERASIYGWSE